MTCLDRCADPTTYLLFAVISGAILAAFVGFLISFAVWKRDLLRKRWAARKR